MVFLAFMLVKGYYKNKDTRVCDYALSVFAFYQSCVCGTYETMLCNPTRQTIWFIWESVQFAIEPDRTLYFEKQ